MRVLVFDTETTGLPETKLINPDILHKWPHIVQFSYVIYDTEKIDIMDVRDYIIKLPKTIVISEAVSNIHGITNDISEKLGFKLVEVLKEFFYYLKTCDILVGHNISFDINMLRVELLRLIYNDVSKTTSVRVKNYKKNLHFLNNYANVYCTLRESIQLCNIEMLDKFGKKFLKFPKLIELHKKLFGFEPKNLHNSLVDILITLKCFVKMNYDIDLEETCDKFKRIIQKYIEIDLDETCDTYKRIFKKSVIR
jgi:DNA polymerase III epsilon subunit-like protein